MQCQMNASKPLQTTTLSADQSQDRWHGVNERANQWPERNYIFSLAVIMF